MDGTLGTDKYVWLSQCGKTQGQLKWPGVNRGQEDWKVSGKLTSEKPYHILKKKFFNIREMDQGEQNTVFANISLLALYPG